MKGVILSQFGKKGLHSLLRDSIVNFIHTNQMCKLFYALILKYNFRIPAQHNACHKQDKNLRRKNQLYLKKRNLTSTFVVKQKPLRLMLEKLLQIPWLLLILLIVVEKELRPDHFLTRNLSTVYVSSRVIARINIRLSTLLVVLENTIMSRYELSEIYSLPRHQRFRGQGNLKSTQQTYPSNPSTSLH